MTESSAFTPEQMAAIRAIAEGREPEPRKGENGRKEAARRFGKKETR